MTSDDESIFNCIHFKLGLKTIFLHEKKLFFKNLLNKSIDTFFLNYRLQTLTPLSVAPRANFSRH